MCREGHSLAPGMILFIPLIAGTLLWAGGCRRESNQSARNRDVRLLSDGEPPKTVVPRPLVTPNPGQCAPLRTVSVRLTGRMEEERKFGPPGFGETPEKDAKLTIVLLRLATPLNV